ncbi:hypothetical protein HpRN124_05090 [Helicobacter pylori]
MVIETNNNNNNVAQMSMSDLLALVNSNVGSESVAGGYGSEAVESEAPRYVIKKFYEA